MNDYFTRDVDRGEFSLHRVSNGLTSPVQDYKVNLHNGIAALTLQLPANCQVGDELSFSAIVNDSTRVEEFENTFVAVVMDPRNGGVGYPQPPGTPGKRPGKEREMPSGIALPEIRLVHESEWPGQNPPFDQYTALRIVHAGTISESGENGNGHDIYDFYVNMDNVYLKSELKQSKQDVEVARAQFKYGLVLLGLGLLHDHAKSQRRSDDSENNKERAQVHVEDQVEILTKAIAPILLPMIESLGALEPEEQ